MNNTWNKQQCDEVVQAIEQYFEGYLEPPFTYTSEDKETMVDDLCGLIVERISEAQNNG
jgi:hypothetical protein